MSTHKRRWMLALVLLAATAAAAQSFTLKDAPQLASLSGTAWRLQMGDSPVDPASGTPLWAQPGFDDSHWKLTVPDQPMTELGWGRFQGFLWYRIHLHLPRARAMAVAMQVLTSYELYANGANLGGRGGMPPHEARYGELIQSFALPADEDVLIAVRVWAHTLISPPGLAPGELFVGDSELVRQRVEAEDHADWLKAASSIALVALEFGGSVLALCFFLVQRRRAEYLWLGAWMTAQGVLSLFAVMINDFRALPYTTLLKSETPLTVLAAIAEICFVLGFVHQRVPRWIWPLMIAALLSEPLAGWLRPESVYAYASLAGALLTVWMLPWIAVRLLSSARAGNREAGILLVPVVLFHLATTVWAVTRAAFNLHMFPGTVPVAPHPILFQLGPLAVELRLVMFVGFAASLLAVLLYRLMTTSREQERGAAELEAARTVQRMLVPEYPAACAGVTVETAYLPFSEVGGDFFDVLPQADGSRLVVIGDVAGKGVQAALRVAAAIGALRDMDAASPAEVLRHLNAVLLSFGGGGFTTCLCGRISASGALTVANAGHLAPYRNGSELELPTNLPLGVTGEISFEERTVQLNPGDRLTLISDGVVEARNAKGELLGFEQAKRISAQSAASIAEAAHSFGQEDDITVLSLCRQAAPA